VGCIGWWNELEWLRCTDGQFNDAIEWRRLWTRTLRAGHEKWRWARHLHLGTERGCCHTQPSDRANRYAQSTDCSSGDEEWNGCQQSRGCVWEGIELGWTEVENGFERCMVQVTVGLTRRIFKVQIRSNIIRYVATSHTVPL
jgi:hypothetical protein